MATLHPSFPLTRSRDQNVAVLLAAVLLAGLAVWQFRVDWRQGAVLLIGAALGWTLWSSSFGFASAYRKLLARHEVAPFLAQLLMIGAASLLFAPILARGEWFGHAVEGAAAPLGVAGALGAVLFGIGMQLGGACGCGTLFSIGGGALGLLLTLFTFTLGAFSASLMRAVWASWPSLAPVVLSEKWGWPIALLFQFTVLGVVAWLLWRWGQKSQSAPQELESSRQNSFTPWPLWVGALVLAVLNALMLVVSGQPWRITWGFALAAAQGAENLGWSSQSSAFWSAKGAQKALDSGIWADFSALSSVGLVLGALLAASVARQWQPRWEIAPRAALASLVGGFMMGFGAFAASGCNVNAWFGGLASTSLHALVWIGGALVGTALGLRLRPLFGLPRS